MRRRGRLVFVRSIEDGSMPDSAEQGGWWRADMLPDARHDVGGDVRIL
jgi:hypothetical protein